MNYRILKLIKTRTFNSLLKPFQNKILLALVWLFGLISLVMGFLQFRENKAQTEHYRTEMRHNWEHRPDKHPHRMAHYGYVAMREAHPLIIFDKGLDDFLGNIIFLEAHKQNSANLSQAGGSGVLVRFGTFSAAFILQIIVPLLLFFVGFNLITEEKEHSTLKIINLQGAGSKEIIWGKIFGLWTFSLVILLPFAPAVIVFSMLGAGTGIADLAFCILAISGIYAAFYFVISCITLWVSARSRTSAHALLSLIGLWLLMAVFFPKITQFFAQNLYPSPSRIAFETEVEHEVMKTGDSHNPDDVHFKHLKDSLLTHYKVDSEKKLPFNYSGFVMKEGEKISSRIYAKELGDLQNIYKNQLVFTQFSGFFNPISTIRDLSMNFSGTDYFSYQNFQNQAENYRYYIAQRMNDLQIEHVSNIKPKPGEKPLAISNKYWKETKDFHYQPTALSDAAKAAALSLFALLFWIFICVLRINSTAKKLKFL